jgi:hypothetical protein
LIRVWNFCHKSKKIAAFFVLRQNKSALRHPCRGEMALCFERTNSWQARGKSRHAGRYCVSGAIPGPHTSVTGMASLLFVTVLFVTVLISAFDLLSQDNQMRFLHLNCVVEVNGKSIRKLGIASTRLQCDARYVCSRGYDIRGPSRMVSLQTPQWRLIEAEIRHLHQILKPPRGKRRG